MKMLHCLLPVVRAATVSWPRDSVTSAGVFLSSLVMDSSAPNSKQDPESIVKIRHDSSRSRKDLKRAIGPHDVNSLMMPKSSCAVLISTASRAAVPGA